MVGCVRFRIVLSKFPLCRGIEKMRGGHGHDSSGDGGAGGGDDGDDAGDEDHAVDEDDAGDDDGDGAGSSFNANYKDISEQLLSEMYAEFVKLFPDGGWLDQSDYNLMVQHHLTQKKHYRTHREAISEKRKTKRALSKCLVPLPFIVVCLCVASGRPV